MIKKKTFQDVINDLSRYPNARWISVLWLILHTIKYGPTILPAIYRILKANRTATDWIVENKKLPSIDVLIPCTKKDSKTLSLAVQSVIVNSINPINKISIICPSDDVHVLAQIINLNKYACEIEVSSERNFVDDIMYEEVFAILGNRAGHAIQQFVKLNFVASSKSAGVLVLDSDTILLRRVPWLDDYGNQSLYLSWENVIEHYDHLDALCGRNFRRDISTVTHHMLMQPSWVREFMGVQSEEDIKAFNQTAFDLANKDLSSIFSLDYLFYGLNALSRYPEKIVVNRWCNASATLESINREIISIYELGQEFPYKSVSFHSWQE